MDYEYRFVELEDKTRIFQGPNERVLIFCKEMKYMKKSTMDKTKLVRVNRAFLVLGNVILGDDKVYQIKVSNACSNNKKVVPSVVAFNIGIAVEATIIVPFEEGHNETVVQVV